MVNKSLLVVLDRIATYEFDFRWANAVAGEGKGFDLDLGDVAGLYEVDVLILQYRFDFGLREGFGGLAVASLALGGAPGIAPAIAVIDFGFLAVKLPRRLSCIHGRIVAAWRDTCARVRHAARHFFASVLSAAVGWAEYAKPDTTATAGSHPLITNSPAPATSSVRRGRRVHAIRCTLSERGPP
ncbi:hypothetical protein [Niveibacterium sp.]|uniref:hypothetical protein n=1 Tax=Niveibacterium sp. TaxID=2017444 RepID=UPI0035B4CF63